MARLSLILSALSALLPTATAANAPHYYTIEAQRYIQRMCMPHIYHNPRTYFLVENYSDLRDSIFPCEQQSYIGWICMANGTSELDLLAEQQCLCDGDFFEAAINCMKCQYAHGDPRNGVSDAALTASYASLSSAECVPTPPFQPYIDMMPTPTTWPPITSELVTLVPDKFPNDTAVSNYLSTVKTATPGRITGSATSRHTRRPESWTAVAPSTTPTQWATLFEPVTVTGAGTGTGTAAASAATETKNGAALAEFRAAGGLMICVFGLAVLI